MFCVSYLPCIFLLCRGREDMSEAETMEVCYCVNSLSFHLIWFLLGPGEESWWSASPQERRWRAFSGPLDNEQA